MQLPQNGSLTGNRDIVSSFFFRVDCVYHTTVKSIMQAPEKQNRYFWDDLTSVMSTIPQGPVLSLDRGPEICYNWDNEPPQTQEQNG
jgi:hypothetical protein